MLKGDCLGNVLHVDLTRHESRVERREELFNDRLGGAGVGIRLLEENCPAGCDPLGPDNPIVLAVGPLNALFPLASKTVAMFKSPHTGNLGESHCGGRSAIAIRTAGYGAIVIKGSSPEPVMLSLADGKVRFDNAIQLWGMDGNTLVARIVRGHAENPGTRSIMRIGPAGEKQVSYACVTTETYRHFGRLGLGAVFGSKKLKALAVSGKCRVTPADRAGFTSVYDEIFKAAVESPVMKKYHELGTPENVQPLNFFGGLPTRNLQAGKFEGAEAISGESFAKNYLGRRLACGHCPVGCIHLAAHREPYEDEPYFYKTSMVAYDYEPLYAVGSLLGGTDTGGILRLLDLAEELGVDVMTLGVVLAWATEAYQKKMITERETDGLALDWNAYPAYLQFAARIVTQPNEFYRAAARGVDALAAKYGGADFALSFAGNEMPGYHTGPACHVGTLVGSRHSHLDNAGYSIDQKLMVKKALTPGDLARELVKEESWRQILSSLVVCFFARGIYTPEVVARALRVAGFELDPAGLTALGESIYREKVRFKIREGFDFDTLRIPKRILETAAPVAIREDFLRQSIAAVKALAVQP